MHVILAALSRGEKDTAETLIVGVIVVLAIAALAYFGARAAGRPSWGSSAAAIICILGALLLLLLLL